MIQGARRKTLVCFGAGALSVAGFGDLPLWPLTLLSFVILLWTWLRALSAREAAWCGFAYGLGSFLVGVSWVYVSLHDFGMMPAPLAALATLLFCLGLALFPAATGYIQARFAVQPAIRLMMLAPACWMLTEWTRGWLLTGFPWLALGYSQLETPLSGYAPVLGVYGLTLLATMAMGCVVAMIALRGRAGLNGAVLLTVLIGGGLALRNVEWTQPNGAPISVSLLQGNIPQELKFVPGRYQHTLETYARLAQNAPAKLTVLPETAIPRFFDQVEPEYIERLREHAARQSGDMLVPVPMHDEQDRYYNAVVSLGQASMQSYAKVHLVPFGEFVPPGFGWIVNVLQIPLSDFSSGSAAQRPLHVAGERVALNVCYEDAFGEEIIRQLPEATLLVNVSNVAWFGDSLAPEQHLRIARMRSLETGRYMLRATNTGITAIIDATGTVRKRLPAFTEGALSGSAQGYGGATPYVRFGNWAVVILSLVLIALSTLNAGRRA